MDLAQIQEIKEKFNEVIRFSQGILEPKTDELFNIWLKKKSDIIKAFDGKLIYEYPKKVCLELDEKEKKDRLYGFIDNVVNMWQCDELGDFLNSQFEGFFDNMTIEDFKTYNGKVIKKGTKLIKSFKYFIPDERRLEDIQNAASRLIQENKIEGTFCLSVHPLDYLSSSETTYNWRSCHSLDGDYRAGNLSYMVDSSTIVCYLKGEKDEKLPNFPDSVPWNSKKWRVLLFLSDNWDMIFAGRQYPFKTLTGLDFILKEVLPKTAIFKEEPDISWSKWIDKKFRHFEFDGYTVDTSPYIPLGDGLIDIRDLITDVPNSRHYNDLLFSSCYDPFYSFKYYHSKGIKKRLFPLTKRKETHFTIGGPVRCLQCGKNLNLLNGYGSMRCSECELEFGEEINDNFCYCDCCGQRFFVEDTFDFNGETFCENCYNNHVHTCECCDKLCYDDEIYYDEKTQKYVCWDCLNNKEDY